MTTKYTSAVMVGQAIGDALGRPFEFKKPTDPSLKAWDGSMLDGGWGLKAGQYTDDTKMALALVESVVAHGFRSEKILAAYQAWLDTGDLRGIGGTVQRSLHALREGGEAASGKMAGGNGTVMRCAGLGVYGRDMNTVQLSGLAVRDACLTHRNFEAAASSAILCLVISAVVNRALRQGAEGAKAHLAAGYLGMGGLVYDWMTHEGAAAWYRLEKYDTYRNLLKNMVKIEKALKNPDALAGLLEIGTGYYCGETLPAAIYCVLRTDSFERAVELAVRGGEDADTTGAVTGALAGSVYGLEGIPAKYLDMVEDRARFESLDRALLTAYATHA